ncbi:MAG: hypothetical protein K6C69_00990, partial [Lachnospiraceae bacterium]|nr:hypothetical protein [Lachnospiraceae bacterium]
MNNTPEEDDAFLTRVKTILSQVFHTEQEEELNKLGEELNTLSQDGRMLPHIDTIQQYIQRNADTLNGVALYHFASQLLTTSKDTEAVKLGLSILELFHTDQDASLKDIIRILSRCNEFTLFGGYVMRQWKHGNEDLFRTLQEVDGWGRIFGIELLEVDGGEIRAWLMAEGVHNTILPGYSAINTYEKT